MIDAAFGGDGWPSNQQRLAAIAECSAAVYSTGYRCDRWLSRYGRMQSANDGSMSKIRRLAEREERVILSWQAVFLIEIGSLADQSQILQ